MAKKQNGLNISIASFILMSLAIPGSASAETTESAQNVNVNNTGEKVEVKSEAIQYMLRYAGPQINIEPVKIEKPIYTVKYAGPELRGDILQPKKPERPIYTVKYAAPVRQEVQVIQENLDNTAQEKTEETKRGFFYPLYKFFHRSEK